MDSTLDPELDPTLRDILATGHREKYSPLEMADAVKIWRNDSAKDILGAPDHDYGTRIAATRQLDAQSQKALNVLQGAEVARHYQEGFGDAQDERASFAKEFERAGYDPNKLQIEDQPTKNWKGIAQGIRGITDSDSFQLPEGVKSSTRNGTILAGETPVAYYETLHDGEKPRAIVQFKDEGSNPALLNELIAAKKKELASISQSSSGMPEAMDEGEKQALRVRREISDLEDKLKKAPTEPLSIELPDFAQSDVKARIEANNRKIAAQQQMAADAQEQINQSQKIPSEDSPDMAMGGNAQLQQAKKNIEQTQAENARLSKEGVRYLQAERIRQEILKPENLDRLPDNGLKEDFLRGAAGLAINTGTAALAGLSGLGNEWASKKLPEQIEADRQLQNVLPGATARHMEGGLSNDILTGAAESLPLTLAIMATGGTSAALGAETGALAPLIPMYAASYGSKYAQQMQQADDLDAEGRHEEAATLRRLANVAGHSNAIVETASEMISPEHAPFRKGVQGGLKHIAGAMVKEGPLEEGVGQLANNLAEPFTSGGVNQPAPFEGSLQAMGAGAIAALPFGAAMASHGDYGRALAAIKDYHDALTANPKDPKLDKLREIAEEAHKFLTPTPAAKAAADVVTDPAVPDAAKAAVAEAADMSLEARARALAKAAQEAAGKPAAKAEDTTAAAVEAAPAAPEEDQAKQERAAHPLTYADENGDAIYQNGAWSLPDGAPAPNAAELEAGRQEYIQTGDLPEGMQKAPETAEAPTAQPAAEEEAAAPATSTATEPQTVTIRDFDEDGHLAKDVELPHDEAMQELSRRKGLLEALKRCLEGGILKAI